MRVVKLALTLYIAGALANCSSLDQDDQVCNDCCNEMQSIAEMKIVMSETGTDKGQKHGYYRSYGRLFNHLQQQPVRLLEIGVAQGHSLQTWARYFPNYEHIYGIDYNNFQTEKKEIQNDQNITLYLGDQSDEKFLQWICADAEHGFDVIIDDGSHFPQHQIISLQNLFLCLKPGGIYIVEDIETSYWNNPDSTMYDNNFAGNGLYQKGTFIETSKQIIDVLNRQYHQQMDMNFLGIDHLIASIAFEQNLVIFRKVDLWDDGFHDRDYSCEHILCEST